uniref:Pheromone processing endoprotease KexB (EC) n=1 Tax=Ganoderma boninense TaxID=34458 RepID=A0A5K1K3N5_9APHY|nr:Pheromone processing endoprotease KexB (EC [Ganoderma boninense]
MEENVHGEISSSSSLAHSISASVDLTRLSEPEAWWRDHQQWLEERGYMLRPRYHPGWQPSWITDPQETKNQCEDMDPPISSYILDAVRIWDNSLVVLKKVISWRNPHEVKISQYLSLEALRSDPRNHSVHVLDVLGVPDDPDATIMVLPLLRACDNPHWQTEGEVLSFVKQIFEGIQYMHELHVAHRDCTVGNIMYDPRPMFPNMFHPRRPSRSLDYQFSPKHSTRTACPVRYFFIDFGLSRRYKSEGGPPRERPIRGGDKSVPEFETWNGELLDPFPTDIYYLGNVWLVTKHYRGMEFLAPLVKDMVHPDPSQRPTIDDVVRRFDELLKHRRFWTLRSRSLPLDEETVVGWYRNTRHLFRTVCYVVTRKSAVPVPA